MTLDTEVLNAELGAQRFREIKSEGDEDGRMVIGKLNGKQIQLQEHVGD